MFVTTSNNKRQTREVKNNDIANSLTAVMYMYIFSGESPVSLTE